MHGWRHTAVGVGIFVALAANNCSGKSTRSKANGGQAWTDGGEAGEYPEEHAGSGPADGSSGMAGYAASAGRAAGGTSAAAGHGGAAGAGAGGTAHGGIGAAGDATAGQGGDDGTAAAAGAATIMPDELGSRLVLWLDASKLTGKTDGAGVDAWMDQSPAGNHAAQLTSVRRPAYTLHGIHDLPSLSFDGASTFFTIADSVSLRWGIGEFAILVVARGAPSTVTNAMLYQKSNAIDPFEGPSLLLNPNKPASSTKASMQLSATVYVVSPESFAGTVPRLFVGRRRLSEGGATLELRVNGSERVAGPVSAVDVDAPSRDVIIGHNGYNAAPGFQAFQGEISEICAIKGALTNDELEGLERYLLDKYAL